MKKNLTQKEAGEKLNEFGYNEIRRKKNKAKIEILIGVIIDPILIIMMVAMLISIISGYESKHFSEAIVIGILLLVNVTISFVQEVRTISKLDALEKLNEDVVTVIRDDKEVLIPSKEIVVGDLVKLKLGAIARADIEVIEAQDLKVDESFLTGESDEVEKEVGKIIYSNSPIQNGKGYGYVIAIGMDTKIGNIANKVDDVQVSKSQLELKILDISKVLLIIAIITAIVIALLTILNGYSLEETLSITISILIATVPEGLATVLAIVLTFMSQKMASNNALVKKVALLETLGEVEYVCSDKTGTITENKMTVTQHYNFTSDSDILSLQNEVIDTATPTSRAINTFLGNSQKNLNTTSKVIDIIPFNSTIKKSINLLEKDNGDKYIVVVGAPDFLITSVNEKLHQVKEYASSGLRTILITYKRTGINSLKELKELDFLNLEPICLYGIQDPPKQSAIEAISTMHSAKINTVMITGDNIHTAKAIAMQSGIIKSEEDMALEGEQLRSMSSSEFSDIVEKVKVYARVKPEDKYQIISALQEKGKIVAMTGDGTNDSIALKKANVGVAMGHAGTDIAKESADLILLDDNFSTINEAISGGRLIFDNLRKFIRQMLTSNTAHVGGILFALIFGLLFQGNIILPMTAVLILWVNVVSDAIPCLGLGLDNAEKDLMQRPPIDPKMKLLDNKMIIEILIRGLSIGLLVFLTFTFLYTKTLDETFSRTCAFVVLSFGQLIHIFDARSFKTIYLKNPFENKFLLVAVMFSGTLNLLIIFTPISSLFGLQVIPFNTLIITIVISSIPTFVISLIKLIYIKKS